MIHPFYSPKIQLGALACALLAVPILVPSIYLDQKYQTRQEDALLLEQRLTRDQFVKVKLAVKSNVDSIQAFPEAMHRAAIRFQDLKKMPAVSLDSCVEKFIDSVRTTKIPK